MCTCIRVFYLLSLSEQPMYECMKVCYVHKTCLLRACDIHIDACYLLYDMLFPLYVFNIELQLSLSCGLKSIIVVKASSSKSFSLPL